MKKTDRNVSAPFKLSHGITVEGYRQLEAAKDRDKIAGFIQQRFVERYFDPISTAKLKNGFCTMAICCLMVEALESFWQGLPDTNRKSKEVFKSFFERSTKFAPLDVKYNCFHKNVRCGILHQAETTGGWRITRRESAPLFDSATLTINATKFHKAMRGALDEYCNALKQQCWDASIWKKCTKKMDAICANCETSS
jgi:hypothetical protein